MNHECKKCKDTGLKMVPLSEGYELQPCDCEKGKKIKNFGSGK